MAPLANGGPLPPRDDDDQVPVFLDSSYVIPAREAYRLGAALDGFNRMAIPYLDSFVDEA